MTENKPKEFRVGDLVSWKYHVNNETYTQEGKVSAVLYPGQVPCPIKYPSMYVRHTPGGPRKHVSYIIQGKPIAGKRTQAFYWPVVSRLTLVKAAPVPKEPPVDAKVQSFVKAESSYKASTLANQKGNVSKMPNPTKMGAVAKDGLTVTRARQWLQVLEKEGMGGQTLVVAHGNLNKVANLAPSGDILGFYSGLGWNKNKVFAMTETPVGVEWDELSGIRNYMSQLVGTTDEIKKQLHLASVRKVPVGLKDSVTEALASMNETLATLSSMLDTLEAVKSEDAKTAKKLAA